jgi:hypothetical protein
MKSHDGLDKLGMAEFDLNSKTCSAALGMLSQLSLTEGLLSNERVSQYSLVADTGIKLHTQVPLVVSWYSQYCRTRWGNTMHHYGVVALAMCTGPETSF